MDYNTFLSIITSLPLTCYIFTMTEKRWGGVGGGAWGTLCLSCAPLALLGSEAYMKRSDGQDSPDDTEVSHS